MELKDTFKMMISENYKERLKAEYFQLKIRLEGLEKMLFKYKDGVLEFTPSCSYELLFSQLVNMKQYLNILEERLKIENINLY